MLFQDSPTCTLDEDPKRRKKYSDEIFYYPSEVELAFEIQSRLESHSILIFTRKRVSLSCSFSRIGWNSPIQSSSSKSLTHSSFNSSHKLQRNSHRLKTSYNEKLDSSKDLLISEGFTITHCNLLTAIPPLIAPHCLPPNSSTSLPRRDRTRGRVQFPIVPGFQSGFPPVPIPLIGSEPGGL